jgi:acetylornithine deacetylase/succinyl-diaminopimelate desuccinylase-like protein
MTSRTGAAMTAEQVLAAVGPSALEQAARAVVDIPSPTGDEAPLAEYLGERMRAGGIESHVQHLDGRQANAVGRIRGDGTGPDLMLYSPIDTFTTGEEATDVPWAGAQMRPDMHARAHADGRHVTGLGAGNPKGHAATILVTGLAYAEALRQAGRTPRGDLVLAFGAGGMPGNALQPPPARQNTGHGVGASFLLERGWYTDAAVIAKPGDFVAHDEVGLCWFEITVHGNHTYVGSRHRLPYRNPIVDAGRLADRLEQWLTDYPFRHRTATALPQGIIGSVAGGWERMLAATPAACRLRLDVRLAPGQTPMSLKREIVAGVQDLAQALDVAADVELVNAIPPSATEPDSWIVRRTIEAWEAVNGRAHQPVPDNSGATDANILRNRGIPTARVGMPKVAHAADDFTLGMNTVDVHAMGRLAEVLTRVVLAAADEPEATPTTSRGQQ